jgi:hypothetical protein
VKQVECRQEEANDDRRLDSTHPQFEG